MHFVAIIIRATVLNAVASQPFGYAIAGNGALIVIGGLTHHCERRRCSGGSAGVLNLSPHGAEALRQYVYQLTAR